MELVNKFNKRFISEISDAEQIRAIRNAFETVKKRQKENVNRISNLEEGKNRLRKVKEKCIGNEDK